MKNVLTLLIVLCTVSLFAQEQNEIKQPYIEVVGNGELEIVPDQIYISITIHEKWEGKEKITINTQEEKLKEELTKMGIDLTNLELSDENADFIKVKWTKKDILAKTKYVLLVNNAETVRNVFNKLGQIKIYDAKISKVSHSKIEEYKEEVRIKAIKNAKEKASYLLTAIDETLGKPLIIREIKSNYIQQPIYGVSKPKKYSSTLDSRVSNYESLNFQKITLKASIYVKFLID